MEKARELKYVCRLCANEEEENINIFSENAEQLYLQEKIEKYLHITVHPNDQLSKLICIDCCSKLDGCHSFASMALKSQEYFNKILIESNQQKAEENTNIKQESKSLLQKYLTNEIIDQFGNDESVTQMEVRLDPMLFLQCSLETDSNSENTEITVSQCETRASQIDTVALRENSPKIFKTVQNENDETSNDSSRSYVSCKKIVDKKRKEFRCTVCPRAFVSDISLQSHMWGHLPKSRSVLTNSDTNSLHRVNGTSHYYDQESSLNLAADNNLLFMCPVCGKSISTKGNLKVHLETHRPKGKYGCDICGRIFKTQSNLFRHKEYHGGVQFPCDVCGRVYPTNSTLRAHSITHSDARPHHCPLCDKTFKRNQDLKFHINQHTGARPYQCPYCPKAFASSGNCFSHRKRMHPQEVERDRERAAEIMR